jgi:ribonuclease T
VNAASDAECLISVDIEASGPTPGTGSIIAIGACVVGHPEIAFTVDVRPLPDLPWSESAEQVHGLSREHLERNGTEPAAAMERFERWVLEVANGRWPVFVGFNAPFDWMFVADYFARFLGRNPFGISALDIKSYAMGRDGLRRWEQTRKEHLRARYPVSLPHTHTAVDDARAQAELLCHLMAGTGALDER